MSGIVGIVNKNGATVSPQLLWRLTELMAFRGPDAQEIWSNGRVGFGHAMLRTTFESEREKQPCSLDGNAWITADARMDGRQELIRKLESHGLQRLKDVSDAELILRAYSVWDDRCVDHLIGDFAFAVWDERRRRLFCARDHFGVKPFYYAQVNGCLVFGNTLDCVRAHPAISDELNERAISDFLLIGSNEDPNTTFFAYIQRLPAAHTLTWSNGVLDLRRYWTLPIQDEIRYKQDGDYVERFVELLDTAVEDRLRTDRAGVFMSGGMDSTTIAGTTHKLFSKKYATFDLRAYTVVYDRPVPDPERYYAGLVADSLGIPIHFLAADDYRLYERWDQPELRTPEPTHYPQAAISHDLFQQAATRSRIVFSGEGGDVVLRPSLNYLLNLLKGGRVGRLLVDIGKHLWLHRQLPRIGFRTRVRRWLRQDFWPAPYPNWLSRDLEERLDLPARWDRLREKPMFIDPNRPEAYQLLTASYWPYLFESGDPGVTRFPVECRYPLFDLRLTNYLLALPSMPWCIDKRLMRVAMRGTLPEEILRRRKSPVIGVDPVTEKFRHGHYCWEDISVFSPELVKFVDEDTLGLAISESSDANLIWMNLHPVSLNCWLRTLDSVKYNQSVTINTLNQADTQAGRQKF
ncbi:MAG: asparagine synthetase B family protein [Blastocatellia bacterium]